MRHANPSMDAEIKTYLADIKQAAERIIEVTLDKSFEEFEGDWVVRAAVERQFLIIGEATNVIAARDKDVADLLGNYPQIVGFRNILAHRYRDILDRTVWGIIENNLPHLLQQVNILLEQP